MLRSARRSAGEMIADRLIERARRAGRRIVLPEGSDPRVIEAAVTLRREKIAEPIVLGDAAAITRAVKTRGQSLEGVEIIDPRTHPRRQAHVDRLRARLEERAAARAARAGNRGAPKAGPGDGGPRSRAASSQAREGKGPRPGSEADALAEDTLHFAALMVAAGEADGSVGGAIHTTAETLRAALSCIGPARGVRRVSTFFLMEVPAAPGPFLFADCGMIPDPDAAELVDTAAATAASARALLETEPRIALLSFSTKGSAESPSTLKVADAARRLRERHPELVADGELQ